MLICKWARSGEHGGLVRVLLPEPAHRQGARAGAVARAPGGFCGGGVASLAM